MHLLKFFRAELITWSLDRLHLCCLIDHQACPWALVCDTESLLSLQQLSESLSAAKPKEYVIDCGL